MSLPVIVLGAGGHAKVLMDVLLVNRITVLGMTDARPEKAGSRIMGIPVIGNDDVLIQYPPDTIELVNGIGSAGNPEKRIRIFETYKARGYHFTTVIHPSAIIAADVAVGEGTQIMAGSIIQPGCRIGVNAILNTGVVVDHDCQIGDHVHLAPGVVLSGDVKVGDQSHIGTAAAVIQGVSIGMLARIGAGAVVVRDIPSGVKAIGVPAKEVK
ncbi:MAG: acetyltransferase [Syntrophaceae bacterium]